MQLIKINNTDFEVINEWSEMPISMADKLFKLITDEMPEKLSKLYALMVQPKGQTRDNEISELMAGIEEDEQYKIFPSFYGKVIQLLSDVPDDVISKVLWQDRTVFYQMYAEKFVLGLLYFPYDYKAEGIKSFDLDGETLMLPETVMKIGNELPMGNSETIEFAESADLNVYASKLHGGKFEFASNVVSILCRPDGEQYDESTSLKRAEKIHNQINMDVFWEVFFCLTGQWKRLETTMQYYSRVVGRSKQHKKSAKVV